MKLSKSAKALLIILNHVTATVLPHGLVGPFLGRARRDDVGTVSHLDGITWFQDSVSSNADLFSRQKKPDNQVTCDRCKKRCTKNKIKDPKNCRKCIRCPKGNKNNHDFTACIPDTDKDRDKKKDPKEKEQQYQNKKRAKMLEHKKKTYPEKKQKMRDRYEDREKQQRDRENRKKVRFMGRCLVIVPLAMGGSFAKEFAGEYFDEDFLEHYAADMLQRWPQDIKVPSWVEEKDDAIYDDDKFVNQYVEYGNSHTKRSLEWLGLQDANITETMELGKRTTGGVDADDEDASLVPLHYVRGSEDLIESDEHSRRFFWLLVPIFTAVASTAARVGAAAARGGAAFLRVAKETIKVAKGSGSKNSYKKQTDGFGKIAKEGNKFWRSCLSRQGPPK